jgi:glutaminase
MAHFMASFGNPEMPPELVVDAYCRQCAISMNCVELACACSTAVRRSVWRP